MNAWQADDPKAKGSINAQRRNAILFTVIIVLLAALGLLMTQYVIRVQNRVAEISRLASEQRDIWSEIGRAIELAPTALELASDKNHLASQIRGTLRAKLEQSGENAARLTEIIESPGNSWLLFGEVEDQQRALAFANGDTLLAEQIREYVAYPDPLIALGIRTWSSDLQISLQTGDYLTPYKRLVAQSHEIVGRALFRTSLAILVISSVVAASSLLIWFRILRPAFLQLSMTRSSLETAEQTLKERRALFGAAFFAIRDAACICDPSGGVTIANTAFIDFGRRAHPEDNPNIFDILQERGLDLEEFPTKPPAIRDLHNCLLETAAGQSFIIRVAHAGQNHWIVMAIDKTEIASLISEREHDNRLREIGRFVGSVAHDFNNILSAMLGRIEIMQMKKSLRDSAGSDLDNLNAAVRRASHIVSQLLSYAGKQILEYETVSPDVLARQLEAAIETSENIDFRIYIQTQAHIYTDVNFFVTAIENLVRNSVLAIGDEPGTVSIMFYETSESGQDGAGLDHANFVNVAVQDTGGGFLDTTLARAREPFFSTRSEQNGSGLGLSVVDGFVKQCQGRMTIANVDGGACVTLHFPAYGALEAGVLAQPDTVEWLPAVSPEKPVAPRQDTCLLLEDNILLMDIMKEWLDVQGVKTVAFDTVTDALAYQGVVDSALCDWRLPDGTPTALIEQLLAHLPRSRIAIMTGHDDGHPSEFAAIHGISIFHKPLGLSDIEGWFLRQTHGDSPSGSDSLHQEPRAT